MAQYGQQYIFSEFYLLECVWQIIPNLDGSELLARFLRTYRVVFFIPQLMCLA